MPVARAAQTVQVVDERSTTPDSLPVTDALAAALARAASIESSDGFALSFGTLFAGLVTGTDSLGTWLREYLASEHVDLRAKRPDLTPQLLKTLRFTKPPLHLLHSPLRQTVSAKSALTEADRIRRDEGSDEALDVRHVVAAYIGLPNYHEADFRALTLDRPRWGRAFQGWVTQEYPEASKFWLAWFAGAFPSESPPSAPEMSQEQQPQQHQPTPIRRGLWRFDPDVDTDTDLLDVERDAHALASLIASHRTTLPLSIGLFGHWGSGKTFFMRHVQKRVSQLCEEAQASEQKQSEVAYFRHVAQIEFNAWHYSDGEILPSLVEHILQNLKVDGEDGEDAIERRRTKILNDIAEKRKQSTEAAEKAAAVQGTIDAKQSEIVELEGRQQEEREKVAQNLTALGAADTFKRAVLLDPAADAQAQGVLKTLGITGTFAAARDVQTALDGARSELTGIGSIVLPLLRGSDRVKRGLLLLLAVAAPFVVGVVALALTRNLGEVWPKISAAITGLASFLVAGSSWLRKQTEWLAARRRELETAKRAVDESIQTQVDELRAEQARELAARLEKLEQLRATHSALVLDKNARERAIAELEVTLARTSSPVLLNDFIMSRKEADDYRKLLGFVALIRRDFDKLSTLIKHSNDAILAGSEVAPEDDPRLNRIVLYVDDLDRCPEDRVADVLRAVHLLLAFPLFVVVVAVDSRWLSRCLISQYPKIFGADGKDDGEGSATPLDYLEKIFQLPLWLQPLADAQRAGMVQALLAASAPPAAHQEHVGGNGGPPLGEKPAEDPGEPADRKAPLPPAPTQGTTPVQGRTEAGEATKPVSAIDLNPASLDVSDTERAVVAHLAPLLSQTPRVLKRFANTYRLIKGALRDDEMETFVSDALDAPFRICLFHLAVIGSDPECASEYLSMIQQGEGFRDVGVWLTQVTSVVEARRKAAGADAASTATDVFWGKLLFFTRNAGEEAPWSHIPMDTFTEWAPRVARYTFTPA